MNEETIPAEQVISIDPDGKYIIIFPMRLTDAERLNYRQVIDNWWDSDSNFLIADGGVQVVRLEKHGEEKDKKKTGKK